MPITFCLAETFARPPDTVFTALVEIETWDQWVPGLVRIERVTPGPFGPGTRWRETRRVFGREATEEFEVIEYEPPRRLGLRVDGTRGSSKRGEYLFEYRLAPSVSGTELVLNGEIRLGGWLEIVGRLFVLPYRKAIEKDLTALAGYLESERQVP
jgi:uncharacterized protein YndB with AHSA1/START domain